MSEVSAFLSSHGIKVEETTAKVQTVTTSVTRTRTNEIKLKSLKDSIGVITPKYTFSVSDRPGEWTVPHPDNSYDYYLNMYTLIPVAKNAVDNLSNFAIQSGYELEGGNASVKAFLDKVNFDQLALNILKQMIIYGNAYLELDGNNVKLLPPKQMYVVVQKGGNNDGGLIGYKQVLDDTSSVPFKPEQVAHFKWNEIGPAFYGISDLRAVDTTLTSLYNYQNDLGIIMHRYAQPLLHHRLGRPEAPATRAQIDDYKTMVEDRETGQDFISSSDVVIESIQANMRMVQPDGILKHLENQLIAGLGVPEIFVRGGETSNKATADVELQAFDRKVKALRGAFSEVIRDKVLKPFGKVKMHWREMSIQDESVKATMIRDMAQAQVPPEVSFKIVGWDNHIDELKKAKPLLPPSPFQSPGQPGAKKPAPKEKDFKTQAEWIEAIENYKKALL